MTARLQDLPSPHAESGPDRIALVDPSGALTYGQLELQANRLAHCLREAGCEVGDRVALWGPNSKQMVLGMLGALRAGCIYVPIDPASPPTRAAKILRSSEPRVILAGKSGIQELLSSGTGGEQRPRVGWVGTDEAPEGEPIDFGPGDLAAYPDAAPGSRSRHPDLAHILFTSGSTGEPKGVMISHASVLHFVRWANAYFGAEPDDRNSGHSPFFFDLSTWDIYGTLAVGAQLHLVPRELNLLPPGIARFIRERELTQWFSVPSLLHYMARFDAVPEDGFPSLRRVIWCGEVFPTPALVHWMKRLPGATFTNLYGPTETTIASSYHTLDGCPASETEDTPIGRPCDDEVLAVLDEARRPAPAGSAGDLWISGPGLSPGYWRDPEKTAEAFVSLGGRRFYRTGDRARVDAQGRLHYLGRTDNLIKSRGYRIELGEIEAALHALGALSEAAVVAVPTGGFENMDICCAYACPEERTETFASIRTALSEHLPNYMLPSKWRQLPALPRTANGKIDRRSLRDLFASG